MTTEESEYYRKMDETPRNLMREHNPETWDPEPREPDTPPKVNTWDPVERRGVNVPGHRYDRDADMTEKHARRLALRGEFDDLDENQPLPLLSSEMRTDPVEGTQGSYSDVIRLEDPCPKCDSSWGVHKCASTMGGVHLEKCLLCEHMITPP